MSYIRLSESLRRTSRRIISAVKKVYYGGYLLISTPNKVRQLHNPHVQTFGFNERICNLLATKQNILAPFSKSLCGFGNAIYFEN